MPLRRSFGQRRPRARCWSSSAFIPASGSSWGGRSSPETSSRRRRSSGLVGVGATGHGEANGEVLRVPGEAADAVTRSAWSLRGCGHGGGIAGGGEVGHLRG